MCRSGRVDVRYVLLTNNFGNSLVTVFTDFRTFPLRPLEKTPSRVHLYVLRELLRPPRVDLLGIGELFEVVPWHFIYRRAKPAQAWTCMY